MKIAIRVDASLDIGTGHFVRCLTLAEVLAEAGCSLHFVCRHLPEHLQQTVRGKGYELSILGASQQSASAPDELSHSAWLGVSQAQDADETIAALAGASWDWLVVDHYALDFRWESRLRTIAGRLLAIDDIADRKHDCTVLLDQNLIAGQATRYEGLVPEDCMRLLGPRYALLQPRYAELHRNVAPRGGEIKKVLVYFGGADRHDMSGRFITAWLAQGDQDVDIGVVLPAIGEHAKRLRALTVGSSRIQLHEPLPSLAELMAEADLCIGAGGATNWERLCLGLPSLIVTLAENQIPIARELADAGLVQWLGNALDVGGREIMAALQSLLEQGLDPAWSSACMEAVDGLGTHRVCDAMLAGRGSSLTARLAAPEDEALILVWANDPDTRRNAFSPEPISLEAHRSWFQRRLALPAHSGLYVIETASGIPIGQVRFDPRGGEWEISYSLSLHFRGRSLAAPLLLTAIDAWRKIAPTGAHLFILTKIDNPASRRTLLSLGFVESEDVEPSVMRYDVPEQN